MPNITTRNPSDTTLNPYKVADPIDAIDIQDFAEGLSFLQGYTLPKVAATNVPFLYSAATVLTGTLYMNYWKSTGAKVALIEVEPPVNYASANDAPKTAYMNITLPSGATWIGASLFDSTVSSSLREYPYVNTGSVVRPAIRALVDVTNVITSSITTFTCSFYEVLASASASRGHGCSSVNITELPRALVYSASNDVGLENTWTNALSLGQLVDGSTAIGYGFKKLVFDLDRARYQVRSQQNISMIDDSNNNYLWKRVYSASEKTFTYGNNVVNVDSTDRLFFFRAKNLYGTGDTTAPYRIRVVYKTDNATGSHKLTVKYKAYGGSSYSSADINLPPSTTITHVDADINFPTTATDKEVEMYFEATVDTAADDILYVANIFIAENFT